MNVGCDCEPGWVEAIWRNGTSLTVMMMVLQLLPLLLLSCDALIDVSLHSFLYATLQRARLLCAGHNEYSQCQRRAACISNKPGQTSAVWNDVTLHVFTCSCICLDEGITQKMQHL